MPKTILITGASTGFGRDTAKTLVRAGHNVIATMREPETRNQRHADALREQGIVVLELDVTNQRSIEQAVDALLAANDRIDVLINNAGVLAAGVTEAFEPEQTRALFDVNVLGLLAVTRAVLPTLRRQGEGLIINVGSILGRVTLPFFGVYGASKFAVEALTDSLRYEVSQFGIDVALVQPSGYPTQLFDSASQPADDQRVNEYGDLGGIPIAISNHFESVFEGDNPPDPHDVAVAIMNLIETPTGVRPARSVVGASFGADSVNDAVAPIQQHVVESLGLAHLSDVVGAARLCA